MLRVDNSRLKATAACHTQAVIEFVLGYQGKEEPPARLCGKVFHEALATYFRGGAANDAKEVFERGYKAFSDEVVPDSDRLAYGNVIDILDEYLRRIQVDGLPFTVIPESVEKGVACELTDGIELWGLLDASAHERSTGGLYIVDHKTTGQALGSWWQAQFRLSSQMSTYIWLKQQTTDEIVTGAYINAIQLNKLPDVRYKQDGGEYKCKTHKCVISECRQQHANFALGITTRTPEALADWHKDAVALAKRFKVLTEYFGDRALLPYVPQQGKFNGGCTFCQFKDFCVANRNPDLIESMLVHSPWEPWE